MGTHFQDGRTGHNPYACLPGAGWGILETNEIRLSLPGKNRSIPVNYVLAVKQNVYEVMLHWYQSDDGRVFTSGIEQNMDQVFGKVLMNRNDGVFVQLATESPYRQHNGMQENIIDPQRRNISFFRNVLAA